LAPAWKTHREEQPRAALATLSSGICAGSSIRRSGLQDLQVLKPETLL